jgi:hypothetical protein
LVFICAEEEAFMASSRNLVHSIAAQCAGAVAAAGACM